MSDTRFTILGIALIFAGFIILGVFGTEFRMNNIEMTEFGDCHDYSQNDPIPVDCSYRMLDQSVLFGVVVAFIAGGIISLIKGVRGKWDNQVNPEDMVGPSKDNNSEKDQG